MIETSRPIKSLHVNWARGWRGGERQTLLLLEGLRDAGDPVELLARRDELLAARATSAGIPVHHSPATLFGTRHHGIQVVHAHEARGLQWASVARIANQRPLIATRRVATPPGRSVASRFKYRRADRIVAVSEYVRSVMLDWGADPTRLAVVPDAVPVTPIEPARIRTDEIRARLDGEIVIGFAGALVNRNKDPLTLLRAFQRLRRNDDRLALLILGDGPDRAMLESYIADNDVPGVCLAGFVDDPDNYYACMDIFVHPSHMEGLGSAVLEAFSWGLPVVAGRAGALPEIVRDGKTGLLFEPGNVDELTEKLKWMLSHPDEKRALADAGTQLLHDEYALDRMINCYREIYRYLAH